MSPSLTVEMRASYLACAETEGTQSSQPTPQMKVWLMVSCMTALWSIYGGRKSHGRVPVYCSISSSVLLISSAVCSFVSLDICT